MMSSQWWIRTIDWRASAGIIFFIQLVVWNEERRRKNWNQRCFFSFFLLCTSSWWMRYFLDGLPPNEFVTALGHSIYIMILSLVFMWCYFFCYQVSSEVLLYNSMIALTIYRISWNALKLISTIPVREDAQWNNGSPFQSIMSYCLYIGISIGCFFIYKIFIKRPSVFQIKMLEVFIFLLACQMALEFSFQWLHMTGNEVLFFFTALIYSCFNFVMLVMLAFLNMVLQEKIYLENFVKSKQKYYEISREGILSLQIKCHDLKHQIAMIRSADGEIQMKQYINKLTDSIDEYNTVISTGNKDIDVVLTEKNIICSMNKIRFTYIIDGTLFDFLTDLEIYSLLGNAMDNAIESTQKVVHKEKKFISLKANRVGDMVVLVVENYFEHDLKFENGIPITNKEEENYHGFGLRSIMSIAKTHNGGAAIEQADHIFKLIVSMRNEKQNETI